MPELELDGVRCFYQQSGDGPDVVLIHAVTSNLAVWTFSGIVDVLNREYRVTLYDLRGHGRSDAPPTGYSSAHLADDLRRLREPLGIGPAFLVGHSFGGVVAMHAANLYPDWIRGVVLSDTFFPGLRHVEPHYGRTAVWDELRDTFRKVGVELTETTDFDCLFRAAATLSAGQWAELEATMGPFAKGWLRQLPRLTETTCGRDVFEVAGLNEEALRATAQPVAGLYDEHSPFAATSRWLAANLRRCAVETIPGAKHLALVQNPAAFTDAVVRHLRRMTAEEATR